MRKLFWMMILLGGYIWVVTSGRDQMVLEKSKAMVSSIVAWFDDADIDFHLKPAKAKKRSKRWD